ncbi:MAG TPA: helix-turn-helix transcriptional regulator [Mycobacteriales bacterium]|nr:helix-turn-helix transcriptional regulator [Mycobacteriales bacterium]
MDTNPGPVLRRRQAGTRLRQLREAAGRSLSDVAAYLDCSPAKISRIETGRLLARVPDVRNMLDLYGIPEDQRGELLDLIRESREKGWWHEYADILSDGLGTLIGFEDAAADISVYDSYLVPGLLQTREYFYMMSGRRTDITDEQVERYLALRLRRQEILRRPSPPRMHFVIDESALHRVCELGSATAREQLSHLSDVAHQPQVTVQVLTYGAGLGASSGLSFQMFGFADPGDPKVVFADQILGPTFDTKFDVVARYAAAFDGVRADALNPAESIAFVADLLGRLP